MNTQIEEKIVVETTVPNEEPVQLSFDFTNASRQEENERKLYWWEKSPYA